MVIFNSMQWGVSNFYLGNFSNGVLTLSQSCNVKCSGSVRAALPAAGCNTVQQVVHYLLQAATQCSRQCSSCCTVLQIGLHWCGSSSTCCTVLQLGLHWCGSSAALVWQQNYLLHCVAAWAALVWQLCCTSVPTQLDRVQHPVQQIAQGGIFFIVLHTFTFGNTP